MGAEETGKRRRGKGEKKKKAKAPDWEERSLHLALNQPSSCYFASIPIQEGWKGLGAAVGGWTRGGRGVAEGSGGVCGP